MAVVGALRVNLALDSGQFTSGLRKASSEASGFGKSIQKSLGSVGSSGNLKYALGNVGNQLQDIAVQVSGGTSAFRALNQQLPQLLGGFGPLGIAIGTVVGVGGALFTVFGKASDAAKTVDEALKDLQQALAEAKAASDLLSLSQGELAKRFGDAATGAAIATARVGEAIKTLVERTKGQGASVLAPLEEALDKMDALVKRNNDLGLDGFQTATDAVRIFAEQMDLPIEKASELRDGINAFREATEVPAMAKALLGVFEQLSKWKNELGEMPPLAQALWQNLDAIEPSLRGAVSEMEALTGATAAAAAEAAKLAHLRKVAAEVDNADEAEWQAKMAKLSEGEDSRRWQDRGTNLSYDDRQGLPSDDPRRPGYTPSATSSGRGGGGRSSAISETERETKAVADLIQQLQFERDLIGSTEAERRVAITMRQAGSAATSEQRAQIADLVTEIYRQEQALDRVDQAADRVRDGLAGAFTDALTGSQGLRASIGGLLQDLGRLAINEAFQGLLGGGRSGGSGLGSLFGGGGLGNIFKGLFGGFRASGGAVMPGKGYIVGENGAEWFSPNTAGQIVPNHELGGGRTDVRVFVDENGNLRAAIARGAGQVVQGATPGILQAASRNVVPTMGQWQQNTAGGEWRF